MEHEIDVTKGGQDNLLFTAERPHFPALLTWRIRSVSVARSPLISSSIAASIFSEFVGVCPVQNRMHSGINHSRRKRTSGIE